MGRREEREERRRKRWGQIAIGLLLVFLMVVSIVQFSENQTPSTGNLGFNGYVFTPVAEGFSVKAAGRELIVQDLPVGQNGSSVTFQNLYYDFITVEAPSGIGAQLRNASFIITTFDPGLGQPGLQYVDLSRLDLYKALPNVVGGILRNSTDYQGLPVATCADAKPEVPVIEFRAQNETNGTTILRNSSCLVVVGTPQGVLAAKDYLILAYAGVIPDAS
jgi:hypothetical protein